MTVLEEHLALLLLGLQILQHNEATVTLLTFLTVSAVMAVSVMTAAPLKLNPGEIKVPLVKNGLDRPKNRYGRYGFRSFYSIFISTVGVDGARVCLWRFFLALWMVVVDLSQFPATPLSCDPEWFRSLWDICPYTPDSSWKLRIAPPTACWNHFLGVLSHHFKCEMKSPHLTDFSWDLVVF